MWFRCDSGVITYKYSTILNVNLYRWCDPSWRIYQNLFAKFNFSQYWARAISHIIKWKIYKGAAGNFYKFAAMWCDKLNIPRNCAELTRYGSGMVLKIGSILIIIKPLTHYYRFCISVILNKIFSFIGYKRE
jgi:hypothetical protein